MAGPEVFAILRGHCELRPQSLPKFFLRSNSDIRASMYDRFSRFLPHDCRLKTARTNPQNRRLRLPCRDRFHGARPKVLAMTTFRQLRTFATPGILAAAACFFVSGMLAQTAHAQIRVEADWLYWNRINQTNAPLLNGPDATNSKSIGSQYAPGYRLGIGGALGDYELEGIFTSFNTSSSLTGTLANPVTLDNSGLPGNSIAFPNAIFPAASTPTAATTPADQLAAGAITRLREATRLKDFELNLGTNRNTNWWRFGLGYRHISLNDNGQYSISGTFNDVADAPGALISDSITNAKLLEAGLTVVKGPATGFDLDNAAVNGPDTLLMSYQGAARNRLDGIQAIFGARLFPGEWLTIDGTLKAGVFSNVSSGTLIETYTGPAFNTSSYQRTLYNQSRGASYAGGAGLKAIMALTDYINLTAGYELLFLNGVALGNNQFNGISTSVTGAQSYHVTSNGHTLFHGLNVGMEVTW